MRLLATRESLDPNLRITATYFHITVLWPFDMRNSISESQLIFTFVIAIALTLNVADAEQIYWTNRFDGTVNVSDTTAHTTTQLVSIPGLNPWGIALNADANKLFFTSGNNEEDFNAAIYSVGTNGQNLVKLTSSTSATRQIELDVVGGKMYWAAEGESNNGYADSIYQANLDGSEKQAIISALGNPRGLALSLASHQLYFESFVPNSLNSTVMKSELDGSNRLTLATAPTAGIWGMDLDPIHHRLYWGTSDTHVVMSSNLDGTNLKTVLSGLPFDVLDVKIDALHGHLYASGDNYLGVPGGAIIRANLDGSGLVTLFSGVRATNIAVAYSPVPEPSSAVLLSLGGIGLAICACRRRGPA